MTTRDTIVLSGTLFIGAALMAAPTNLWAATTAEKAGEKAEQAARVIDQRKAKYPALAAAGTEDDVFATASEATLAKLNALADDEPKGTFIAPTGPKRGAPAQPKTYAEMSKQELLDEMKRTLGG